MQLQMARFVVTGASFTENARNRMREGDWKGALEVLTDGLEGMTFEQAISIIEGKARLEGVNENITMVDEVPDVHAALQEEYDSVFGMGGYIKHNNRMYQAYRVIDNLGPDDALKVSALPEYQKPFRGSEDWYDRIDTVHMKACYPKVFDTAAMQMRGMYYANYAERDFCRMVRNKEGKWVLVLFEEVTDVSTPFWRQKENTDAQAAYDQIAQYLEVFGYCQRNGYDLEQVRSAYQNVNTANTPTTEEQSEAEAKRQAAIIADQAKAEAFKAECERLRKAITEFADQDGEDGWYTHVWKDPKKVGPHTVLRAPRRALLCYALSTTNARNLMPEYTPFSPEGLKLARDNPYHTDVWLGCGFDIDDSAYDRNNPNYHAVIDMIFTIQKKLLNFEAQVLARGPEMTGTIVHHDSPVIDATSILVVPHAGEEFHVQAMKAGAVICEVGGRLAHLVTVCRETNKPIIRVDNAMTKFKVGQSVRIKPDEGKILINTQPLNPFATFF